MDQLDQAMDMDNLLDMTLDDLADMPEFKPFPAGAHRCTIKWALKKIGELEGCPELTLTLIETVEQNDSEATPAKAGDTTSVAFMLKKKDKDTGKWVPNDLGQGQFKEILKSLAEAAGSAVPREIMDKSNGMEVLAVTAIRTDKRDKDNLKYYTDVKNVQVM